jgi:heptaprenyl diphosphate synthase
MCRGELRQIDDALNPTFSRREYRRRIIGKTALLITASLVVGASEAEASRPNLAALARVGYNLGMAFQIIDDLLDFTADSSTLGKPTATDLQSGVYTLPVIEAAAVDPGLAARLRTPPRTPGEVEQALEEIDAAGGFERARAAAREYTARAERALTLLSRRRQRAVLTELTQRLLHRQY